MTRFICCATLVLAAAWLPAGARTVRQNQPQPPAGATTYDEARGVLDALRPDLLPEELRALDAAERESAWPAWVVRRDEEIRERLDRGDEDSVVMLLLFGATFTTQPRYSFAAWASDRPPQGRAEDIVVAAPAVRRRISDLAAAIAAPGANERLQFAREVIERHGITPSTTPGRQAAEQFLLGALQRTLADYDEYFREPSVGATLFRRRGLVSDTSVPAAFAIDRALADLAGRKRLAVDGVLRIAIVGPGLDFADKQEGLDVYPIQTIQPFAVVDGLRRLGAKDVRVVTYDVNPRVTRHVDAAIGAARAGRAYLLHLPRDEAQRWSPELVAYWQQLGGRIGKPTAGVASPSGVGAVAMRAVNIDPAIVQTLAPHDLNVVLQRPALAADERFDVVIATNVLIYYDVFEQSLAFANIAAMLRPAGLLLTNTPLFELPSIPMRLVGETPVAYTDAGRDWIMWYERE
ncbi:MAG: class I SAM-dependent methyltransferase [Acidobacteria bacterium]|nr:class I SAM-dependent methyltransferase [Acidobacteriota bacterium]